MHVFAWLGMALFLATTVPTASADCPRKELFENVIWCNDPTNKDRFQVEGRNLIHQGTSRHNPGQILVGYLMCQHHRAEDPELRSWIEDRLGLSDEEIRGGGAARGIIDNLFKKVPSSAAQTLFDYFRRLTVDANGRPISTLKECAMVDVYRAAFFVTYALDADGCTDDETRIRAAKKNGLDRCHIYGEFPISCRSGRFPDQACYPPLSDRWSHPEKKR